MNPFTYFIFYAILLILSYRVELRWSLLCSILISTYVLIVQFKRVSYETILFIIFFSVIPFISEKFKRNFNAYKSRMRNELESARMSYDNLMGADKKQLESNLEIERKTQQVSSLYEISKEMSECLAFEDIFDIFSSVLKKSFRFRLARLVFLKDVIRLPKSPSATSEVEIDSVYEIELGRAYAKAAPDNFDRELVDVILQERKEILISPMEDPRFSRRLFIIKDFDTLIAIPLISEEKISGILYIENISRVYFENFLILAGQFAIQLQKVILYKKVQEMAITDSLTEVSTRRYFLERFREEIRRSMRRKSTMSFLMIDLDYFKEKNDKFGHLVGDVILKEIALVLKSTLREIDIIGRYGGEEFAVVLAGIGREGALLAAERIRSSVEHSVFKAYDEKVSVTISIGISAFPEDGVDEHTLIESADKALYRAKEKGRNRVE
ncbi:MAG: sensor domain-containing diguanylate cyclase [Candidatus Omnitrophota bacterium]|nr:sensor domain-containing diguanylate cyclase [Candidatus Omnitrophota bacterium]